MTWLQGGWNIGRGEACLGLDQLRQAQLSVWSDVLLLMRAQPGGGAEDIVLSVKLCFRPFLPMTLR